MGVREYEALIKTVLDKLRREYDARLSVLREKAAAEKLRSIHGAAKLRGKVKAGTSY